MLSTPSVEVKAVRERVIVIPRAIAVLILSAGVVALIATRKHVVGHQKT